MTLGKFQGNVHINVVYSEELIYVMKKIPLPPPPIIMEWKTTRLGKLLNFWEMTGWIRSNEQFHALTHTHTMLKYNIYNYQWSGTTTSGSSFSDIWFLFWQSENVNKLQLSTLDIPHKITSIIIEYHIICIYTYYLICIIFVFHVDSCSSSMRIYRHRLQYSSAMSIMSSSSKGSQVYLILISYS